eukprot:TRINITY_DN10740_c0_g1_i1.p3 TRINITY_DN10740_c0_g1~~TRINITY_DN10740_c0_g1_i1.p3  ORF type:complete len:110 (-),score=40.14 TRINITY_DN10740_c0_g1_i1:308-637(-)
MEAEHQYQFAQDNEPSQSKWDWVQEARGDAPSQPDQVQFPQTVVASNPELPPDTKYKMKDKFEPGFLAKPKPPPAEIDTSVVEEESDAVVGAWSPTQIKIENKLVLELD